MTSSCVLNQTSGPLQQKVNKFIQSTIHINTWQNYEFSFRNRLTCLLFTFRLLKKVVTSTGIKYVYVATDKDPMIEILEGNLRPYNVSNSYIANKRGFVHIIPPSWGGSYQLDWNAINRSRG